MYIKDYMSTNLITITPETSVVKASDLLKQHDINRLPVLENGQLVGLITKEVISKNSPSSATSLSAHEVNYLLEKTTAKDIMVKKVMTIGPDNMVEEAASIMRANNIGVLVVTEGSQLVGIITDKDIFKAFVDVSGYDTPGSSLVVELIGDRKGVIEEVGDALVETDVNLTHMIVYHHENNIRLVLHVSTTETDELEAAIKARGYEVKSVHEKTNE
ncbi:CBS domain-containing protein [Fundicoccus ignavus]|uniref:CBS domain-containing protein n=1 Tax=Fundicoccus ignavus TaxID=2664442 RepID=A0A844C9E9_9LACT|nr:CBS domain-containing protein [Fundicoccus ignavus]MRJ46031.1 CBS domain-containing protein [Fundicoccus ignavus]